MPLLRPALVDSTSECLLSYPVSPRFSSAPASSAFAVLLAASARQPLAAQGTHLWTQSRIEEFEKGTPQGVAIGSNGYLREGPGLTDILTTPSTFVWSVAVDKNGTPYLGTGSPATVLRAGTQKDAKPFTLFESRDVSVQVVRIGPDGSLYAATVPGGKVYKLNPSATAKQDESTAKVIFDAAKAESSTTESKSTRESKSHYIWDMTFDAAGKLYIATGGPGAIYRVDPARSRLAKPELFFKCDEQHIRALAWDAKGNLIAGSDGSGLVYRISPQGKGYVLFEAPRREITSVAVAANGTIFAASVGDKSHNPLPPLAVQGVGTITFTIVQPGSLQAANASTSTPEGTEIYALAPDQAPRKIWSSKDDIVYALAAQSRRRARHQRQSRSHLPHSAERRLCRHRARSGATGPQPCSKIAATPSSSAPATPASSTLSANPKLTSTPAMSSTPAHSPASAASKSIPIPPTTKSSPAPATSNSHSAVAETGAGPIGNPSRTMPSNPPPAASSSGKPFSTPAANSPASA